MNPSVNPQAWLTMRQYAQLTQMSLSTVKRLKQLGRLPYTQNGRTVRIPREALDIIWLNNWRQGGAA